MSSSLQGMPFDSKPSSYSSAKPSSPEAAAFSTSADENQEVEQPGTPVPSEDPEVSDNGAASSTPLTKPPVERVQRTRLTVSNEMS